MPPRAPICRVAAGLSLCVGLSLGWSPLADAHPALDRPSAAPQADVSAAEPDAAEPTEDELLDALDASALVVHSDPLEPLNRRMLSVNQQLDRWLIGPVSDAYGFLMPDPGERAVRRFFENLGLPIGAANEVLQARPCDAVGTLARFVVNSTLGVAGLFDPATRWGLTARRSDFGQTLWRWGTPSGPYLMLPVLGPSTPRDSIGDLADLLIAPETQVLTVRAQVALTVSGGISARRGADDDLDALRDSSIDFYAALRAAYYLRREAELRSDPGDSATP